jgi:hypothetical protein
MKVGFSARFARRKEGEVVRFSRCGAKNEPHPLLCASEASATPLCLETLNRLSAKKLDSRFEIFNLSMRFFY